MSYLEEEIQEKYMLCTTKSSRQRNWHASV